MSRAPYNFDFLKSVQSGPVAQFWPTQTGGSLGLEFSPRLRPTNSGSFPSTLLLGCLFLNTPPLESGRMNRHRPHVSPH